MGRKQQKKLVFKINHFSIRNYMTYANFIILVTALIAVFVGLVYAFLYTPQFRAEGLLENRPFSAVNQVAVNSIDQTQQNQANIVQEMDLIKTYNVLSQVVKKINLNIDVKPESWPIIGDLYHRIKEDIKLTQYTEGTLENWLSNSGEPVTFKAFEIPQAMYAKTFVLTYKGDKRFSLTLPDGTVLSAQLNQPLVFANHQAKIIIKSIYAGIGERFEIIPRSVLATTQKLSNKLEMNIPSYLSKQGEAKSLITQNLIEVSYVDRNPFKASTIVNSVLHEAVEKSRIRKEIAASEALVLLQAQRKIVAKAIQAQTDMLASIKSDTSPLSIKDEGPYLLRQLGNIKDEIRLAEQRKVELLQTLTEVNPQVVTISEQIIALKHKLTELETQIKQTPLSVKTSAQLETQLAANNEVLTKLSYQIQQLKAMKKAAIGDLSIVQKAEVPVVNITYSRWVIVMLALGIGLIIGYVLSLAIV